MIIEQLKQLRCDLCKSKVGFHGCFQASIGIRIYLDTSEVFNNGLYETLDDIQSSWDEEGICYINGWFCLECGGSGDLSLTVKRKDLPEFITNVDG